MEKHNFVTIEAQNAPIIVGADNGYGQFLDHSKSATENTGIEIVSPKTEFKFQDLFMENFSVRYVQAEFTHDIVLKTPSAPIPDVVMSCVYLKGHTFTLDQKLDKGVAVTKGDQNFMFDPWNDYVHRTKANTPISFVHFTIDKGYFTKLLPEGEKWSEDVKNKILRNELILGRPNSSSNLIQQQAIQNILSNPLEGSLGKMMIEASFLQFMAIHFKYLFQHEQASDTFKFTKRDKEIMIAVREHLADTFKANHSLLSLSRNFGINESKLMKGFKFMFGKTVFEFIGDLKMEYARRLIEDKGMFVAEVAPIIGYKNPNHFSVAFKNKFGFSPSKLKQ